MLEALAKSVRAQRQFVADASHELRTPLTVLRTSLDILSLHGELPPAERNQLLQEARDELEEMTRIVAELVDLAHGDVRILEKQPVQLEEIAGPVSRLSPAFKRRFVAGPGRRRRPRLVRFAGCDRLVRRMSARRSHDGSGSRWRLSPIRQIDTRLLSGGASCSLLEMQALTRLARVTFLYARRHYGSSFAIDPKEPVAC
jgi:signal transduction histidine kinase